MSGYVIDVQALEEFASELNEIPEREKLMLLGFLRGLKAGWVLTMYP